MGGRLLLTLKPMPFSPSSRTARTLAPMEPKWTGICGAFATSRRVELKTWDRAALNLPFGRLAIVGGPVIRVPSNADAATLEQCRARLEADLNAVTKRAYAIVDGDGRGS